MSKIINRRKTARSQPSNIINCRADKIILGNLFILIILGPTHSCSINIARHEKANVPSEESFIFTTTTISIQHFLNEILYHGSRKQISKFIPTSV